MIEQSLVLLKPDAVTRGLIGEITKRFENAGLKIAGLKMVWIDRDFAKKHYSAHLDKKFYKGLEDFIVEGPVVAMAVEGISAVKQVRKMVGGTEPHTAEPGTVRGDFAHHSYDYTDNKGIAIKNLIHASGTSEEAKKEIALWFNDEEIHAYKSVHDIHTL